MSVIAHRFTIRWDPFGSVGPGGYRVSIPNYDGGEVVVAEDYDALSRQLAGAVDIAQTIVDTWGGKEVHSETAELAVELAEYVLAATTRGQ